MKIKPLADRVLIKPTTPESKTELGIIIPDDAQEKPQQGIIVSVGTGKENEPLTVKVDDLVLYGKHSGTEIKVDGESYLMMRESGVVAILETK